MLRALQTGSNFHQRSLITVLDSIQQAIWHGQICAAWTAVQLGCGRTSGGPKTSRGR